MLESTEPSAFKNWDEVPVSVANPVAVTTPDTLTSPLTSNASVGVSEVLIPTLPFLVIMCL